LNRVAARSVPGGTESVDRQIMTDEQGVGQWSGLGPCRGRVCIGNPRRLIPGDAVCWIADPIGNYPAPFCRHPVARGCSSGGSFTGKVGDTSHRRCFTSADTRIRRSAPLHRHRLASTQALTEASAAAAPPASVPPACAMSGRPPPLPPTCWATKLTSSPAFSLPVRSAVTPAIRLTLPSPAAGQHDGGALQLVLELVQRLAQRRGIGAFQGAASTLMPLTSTA
jgi:hypothetical protein